MKKEIIIFTLFFVFISAGLRAEDKPATPHGDSGMKTGVLTGTLLNGKDPLGNYPILLEIVNGHKVILTLPKDTDQNGKYSFKNIFQSPEFSYAVSTNYEGTVYRSNFVSLAPDEDSKTLDLIIKQGEAGPELPHGNDDGANAGNDGAVTGDSHGMIKSFGLYKYIAIILSIIAVAFAFLTFRRNRK